MSEDVETSFAVPRRPYWQSAGSAVGCAERLLPMAASLGGRAIAETTKPGLALAWKAAAGLGGRSEVEQAIAALADAIYNAAGDGFEVWEPARPMSRSSRLKPSVARPGRAGLAWPA